MAKNEERATNGLTAAGFLFRFVAALVLVAVTYNPSGESAYHWISTAIAASEFGPLHLLLVAVLLIGWVVFWIATWRSLGTLGVSHILNSKMSKSQGVSRAATSRSRRALWPGVPSLTFLGPSLPFKPTPIRPKNVKGGNLG